MNKPVKLTAPGFHAVTPFLIVKNAVSAIEFYKKAFAAKESICLVGAGNKIVYAALSINDSPIMLADEHLEINALSPQSIGGSPVTIHLYVNDVEQVFELAVANGGKIIRAIENQFFGDRTGTLQDPFGHNWHVATHQEDVSVEEIQQRFQHLMQQH